MRIKCFVAAMLLIPCVSVSADTGSNYYGPMRNGVGYKDKLTDDGYWKIEAATQGGMFHAEDVAIYRAAEMARQQGVAFVEIHDAYTTTRRLMNQEQATLYARPAAAPVHPAACRSGKEKRCYTADVAIVIAKLSGPSGREPGVGAPSYVDEYGRTVTLGGFGLGAVPVVRSQR